MCFATVAGSADGGARGVVLTSIGGKTWIRPIEVLLAVGRGDCNSQWLQEVDTDFRAVGLTALGAFSEPEAIRRVESGRLAGAVLFPEAQTIEGFSLLRIIRSINADLPCWMVMDDPTPQTLHMAFALRVQSVMRHPVEAQTLSITVARGLDATSTS